jgi:hypothetical protein
VAQLLVVRYKWLAMEEDVQNTEQIRDADAVARRCIILYAVVAAGHNEPRDQLVAWLRHEGLWEAVTPKESEFLLSKSPTRQQQVNATWRAEALFSLVWSLGLIGELSIPQQLCDVQLVRSVLPPLFGSVGRFISEAKLRNDSELHDANEKIYQIHWHVRDAQRRHEPTPPGRLPRMPHEDCDPPAESLNPSVVQERHYALNWLIGYCGQDWDDITTDT